MNAQYWGYESDAHLKVNWNAIDRFINRHLNDRYRQPRIAYVEGQMSAWTYFTLNPHKKGKIDMLFNLTSHRATYVNSTGEEHRDIIEGPALITADHISYYNNGLSLNGPEGYAHIHKSGNFTKKISAEGVELISKRQETPNSSVEYVWGINGKYFADTTIMPWCYENGINPFIRTPEDEILMQLKWGK